MPIGAFTGQFDLPLLLVQLFFLFFLGLVYHLRQEDKREGYPLVSHRDERTGGRVKVVGFPPLPEPKAFIQSHGRPVVYAPREEDPDTVEATGVGNPNGMPIEPVGNPLLSRTGAAAWMPKTDLPDLSWDGAPVFVPLRVAPQFRIMKGDPDPRGFAVFGLDREPVGHVVDVWLDKGEHHARFLEVELDASLATQRAADAPERRAAGGEPSRVAGVLRAVAGTVAAAAELAAATVRHGRDVLLGDRDTRQEPGEPSHEAEETAEVRWRAAMAVPAPADRILLPTEFASVNGRRRTVRSAAITAAQFADVPGRQADTIVTAREEQRIRGYFGGGLLWGTPNRLGPVL